ncbi:leucine rich repeat domain protein, partial [Reticulomyxa filosa]
MMMMKKKNDNDNDNDNGNGNGNSTVDTDVNGDDTRVSTLLEIKKDVMMNSNVYEQVNIQDESKISTMTTTTTTTTTATTTTTTTTTTAATQYLHASHQSSDILSSSPLGHCLTNRSSVSTIEHSQPIPQDHLQSYHVSSN